MSTIRLEDHHGHVVVVEGDEGEKAKDLWPLVVKGWKLAHQHHTVPGIGRGSASPSLGFGPGEVEAGWMGKGRQLEPRAEHDRTEAGHG